MRTYLTVRDKKIGTIALLICLVALAHFIIPTDRHQLHVIHIILRKIFFLPPVIAAAWFGFRGGLYTTLAVSVLFSLHAFLDWPGNYMEQANQVGELVSFWAVGLIAGSLFERERTLLRDIAKAHEETLQGLVSALDLREQNTSRHSQRVRDYALRLAERLGLDEEDKRFIGFGALLHDVGKIGTPDAILLKPGSLTDEERKIICEHASAGHRIVSGVGYLQKAAEIVHAHHEHYDGSGYPRGLKGEEIPLGARLFAVIDVYDALTSRRPYHLPLSHEQALAEIREKSGSHFDRDVVHAFESIAPEIYQAIGEKYPDSG